MLKKLSLLFFIYSLSFVSLKATASSFSVDIPKIIIADTETEISISTDNQETGEKEVIINGESVHLIFTEGKAVATFIFQEEDKLKISLLGDNKEFKVSPIPLWQSILPPLIAILLALLFKEVVSSLIIGLFAGVCIIYLNQGGVGFGLIEAFMVMIDHYLLNALNDSGHLSIIVFSTLIGGMVSVISKNGGMQGVVNRISKYAKTPQTGQLATWFLGIAIFFDDYANTLIVGNTMRPVTDKLKVSREKLAYLVDSTAAPIAAIAFITTWIGAELGYIESGIKSLKGINEGVYASFISSLTYSFYPIYALLFMLLLIWKKKDFGPMLIAEQNAREGKSNSNSKQLSKEESEEFNAKAGIKVKSYNAVIPVATVIIGTILGLLYTGWDADVWEGNLNFGRKLSTTIGNADSYKALLWASSIALIIAIKLSVIQKLLKLSEAIESAIHGFKTMLPAIVILILAWSLAAVIEDLKTADLLTSLMSDNFSPYLIPTVTFLLAAIVAFSTGSSWGTMAILYPLMLPASWQIAQSTGLDYSVSLSLFHNTIACVLAGAVLGDHCSPISDTTILSSLASSCNHISHVKTQMPYALTVGGVSILFGTLPAAFGISPILCFTVGLVVMYTIIRFFGKEVPN